MKRFPIWTARDARWMIHIVAAAKLHAAKSSFDSEDIKDIALD
jgi:hypothetical protein